MIDSNHLGNSWAERIKSRGWVGDDLMGKNEMDSAHCHKLEFGSHGISAGNVLRDIFVICSVDSITRREE